jgi:murein DD-endopeptidase MepM/ murein hydrolase activator NlpD
MRSLKTPGSLLFLAAIVGLTFVLASCQTPTAASASSQDDRAAAHIAQLNQAAYPEGCYTVQAGDTPRSIAARLGLDYSLFANANGITEKTVLTPGWVLVVPKVERRTDQQPLAAGAPGAGPKASEVPQSASSQWTTAPAKPPAAKGATPADQMMTWTSVTGAPITGDGRVNAISAGKVTEVHRGYPTLGDVVIIENQDSTERAVYAGRFTPVVAVGQAVNPGQQIGKDGRPGGVKVTRFMKAPR